MCCNQVKFCAADIIGYHLDIMYSLRYCVPCPLLHASCFMLYVPAPGLTVVCCSFLTWLLQYSDVNEEGRINFSTTRILCIMLPGFGRANGFH